MTDETVDWSALKPFPEGYVGIEGVTSEEVAEFLHMIGRGSSVVERDPKRNFGEPMFVRGGAPVDAVLDRFRAGESIADIAEDFEILTG